MKKLVVYLHGKGGSAEEAAHYKPLFPGRDVIGLDYQAQTPWDAREELIPLMESFRREYDSISLIANSVGAFFALSSLAHQPLEQALLISPVVDMEQLIGDMMKWANVTETQLMEQGQIETAFGETLSWEYLCYVRAHPIRWAIPTSILYGGQDHLTSFETISRFSNRIGAELTVMPKGEHWFHTDEQMAFLDAWIRRAIR